MTATEGGRGTGDKIKSLKGQKKRLGFYEGVI